MLQAKKILLGVTGGIAAYKSADLVRRLREAGAEVRVAMTSAAKALITPLTFQALSGHPVITDWQEAESEFAMDHIALTRWADVILIAPATADFMAKLAHGFASDVLSTLCLAAAKPIVLAPAMNRQMWKNAATQANAKLLLERGMIFLGPASGSQACGEVGDGRMLEPMEIVEALATFDSLNPLSHEWERVRERAFLEKLNILITAGPTQEAIDPVRFLSNHSSGKMGYALAQAAAEAGAKVTLVSGPTQLGCPLGVTLIAVTTAQQMYDAVMQQVAHHDIFIANAAVADYRCENIAEQKIKKNADSMTLNLVKNPDILAAVAALKNPPFTVGFAAETHDIIAHARIKLKQKKLNMIAVNDVSQLDSGFNADDNAVTVLWPQGEEIIARRPKMQLATALLLLVKRLYRNIT